ncbi:structural maintenance of chromosomes protein 3-like [Styela clava]|uniref:structural maintenance of chromosomes protein 3-like n=1 Tax=Styela clava TaxID=7725 RepID=UPI001939D18A|nr:structural maintenance of chromosomes protein 3-like [Styela clava]
MHIKSVSIQGFRSYRESTEIEPFSPKHNIIVGRNGSGKSNFFSAIQFVFSDEYSNLRAEQRQQLLHEGTGARVISACVEIVFDNSDNRLPIEKDEVTLRRVIGSKKDQYFLDKKMVTKNDVMNLLESAGFSRSNPYYIVKQGKINQMATAPDSYRLRLLREVAGTRVYDERKSESETLMKESETRLADIEKVLAMIEDRLSTLNEEKEELAQYQQWDKTRRALEYTIYNQELTDTRNKLDTLSNKRENNSLQTRHLRQQQEEAQRQTKDAQKQLSNVNTRIDQLSEEKDLATSDRQELIKKKAQLELACTDLREEMESDQRSLEQAQAELGGMNERILKKTDELNAVTPQYEEMEKLERETEKELKVAEQRRKELFAKQGRGNQFRSREERDTWIKNELRTLERGVRDKQTQITNLQEEIQNSQKNQETLQKSISEKNLNIQEHKTRMDALTRESTNLKRLKDDLQGQRQRLWRDESKILQELDSISSEIKAKEHTLNSIIGKATVHGLESIKRVMKTFSERGQQDLVDGYKGMLMENFRCSKNFFTCVEVTAGGRLFNHVVSTDRIGTKYLNEMNQQKLPGEVTFLPLNKLEVRDVEYPQTSDAIPMISKLQFSDDYGVAIKYVFGKTLICRSMEVSTQLARVHQLDCVTLEGDQVSRRGALTGGYVDNRKSRLDLYTAKQDLHAKLEEKQEEIASNKREQQKLEAESTKVMDDLQKLETKNKKNKDVFEKLKADVRMLKEQQQAAQRAREPKERSLAALQTHCEALKSTEKSLKEEVGTNLLSQLSAEDQMEVDRLNDLIKQLTVQHKDAVGQRVRLEGKKTSLQNLLEDNLVRRKEQLMQEMQELSVDVRKQKLEQSDKDRTITEEKLRSTDARLKELETEVMKLERDQGNLSAKVEDLRSKEREMREKITDDARELEKVTNKQSMLIKKKDESMRKIRDLGSLPQDSFDKYQGLSVRQLMKRLDECNQELKKYSHVNKKALDQFVSFSEQKEKLLKRKEEVDRGKQAILNLMEHMEHQKYEAIQFTFRQVSKNFSDVFVKLVPGGKATLIMKKGENQSQPDGDAESEPSASIVDQFVGVGIKVSFSGKAAETREMQQLSGGQKSLVALALIFAIQKCDPAPFYLFDEIDQALDPAHRSSVANMIKDLCQSAQFITTTFRPELLEAADKFYGVIYRNKVSLVRTISKEEAREFVEDDTMHG